MEMETGMAGLTWVWKCCSGCKGSRMEAPASTWTLPAARPACGPVIKAVPPFESSTREREGEV